MSLYAETSAVLRWTMIQADGRRIGELLREADQVIASRLTILEANRVVWRTDEPEEVRVARRAGLARTVNGWSLISMDAVVERAVGKFPVEPVRTLDAIHLATALMAREQYPDLVVLSVDERIRANAVALGFTVLP